MVCTACTAPYLYCPPTSTGVLLSQTELQAISDVCGAAGVWLVLDNTYEDVSGSSGRLQWDPLHIYLHPCNHDQSMSMHSRCTMIYMNAVIKNLLPYTTTVQCSAVTLDVLDVLDVLEVLWVDINQGQLTQNVMKHTIPMHRHAAMHAVPHYCQCNS